jgi:hypothetical protein
VYRKKPLFASWLTFEHSLSAHRSISLRQDE